MLKNIGLCIIAALLTFGRPSMAEDNRGSAHAGASSTNQGHTEKPPVGAITNPTVPTPCTKSEPCYTQNATPEHLLPEWRRPEWVSVYVAVIYSIITGLMWLTIKRQADIMQKSATTAALDAKETLEAIRLQAALAGQQVKIAATAVENAQLATGTALEQLKIMQQQALEMKAQTVVSQTSAEAAKLSADALVSADRPWVQVVITRPLQLDADGFGKRFYKIWPTIENRGKTPAHIETIVFRPHILPSDSSFPEPTALPPEPDYIVKGQTVYTAQKGFLPPDTGIEPIPVKVSAEDFRALKERSAFLYVYGQVFYRGHTGDGLMSSFCFLYYVPPATGMDHPEGFVTYASIPEAYFEYT